jgi:A/G-specific adenine glycosylase
LPQIEDGQGVVADYLLRTDMEVSERVELEEFTHTFTHFKLHIVPVLLRVACKPVQVQQAGSEWMDLHEALQVGIPSPVRSLLQKIKS